MLLLKKGKYKDYKHNKDSCVRYKRVAWRPPTVETRHEKSESDSDEGETDIETTDTVNQESEDVHMENDEENAVNEDIFYEAEMETASMGTTLICKLIASLPPDGNEGRISTVTLFLSSIFLHRK